MKIAALFLSLLTLSLHAETTEWAQVPQILARIVAPTFPARDFDITKFGAVADGKTDCTAAIAKAIDACAEAGGGSVIVPAGEFLTGAIHLKSNVDLHLEKNSVLKFSTDPNAYLPVVFTRFEGTELYNLSPLIYALGQSNIAVTGEGTLDGQADESNWLAWKNSSSRKQLTKMAEDNVPVEQRQFGVNNHLRPDFIEFNRCQNILIEGVKIRRSPVWELLMVQMRSCTNEQLSMRGLAS